MDVVVGNGKAARRRDGDLKVGMVSTICEARLTQGDIHIPSGVRRIIQQDGRRNCDTGREVRISHSTEADRSDLACCAVVVRVCEVDM